MEILKYGLQEIEDDSQNAVVLTDVGTAAPIADTNKRMRLNAKTCGPKIAGFDFKQLDMLGSKPVTADVGKDRYLAVTKALKNKHEAGHVSKKPKTKKETKQALAKKARKAMQPMKAKKPKAKKLPAGKISYKIHAKRVHSIAWHAAFTEAKHVMGLDDEASKKRASRVAKQATKELRELRKNNELPEHVIA